MPVSKVCRHCLKEDHWRCERYDFDPSTEEYDPENPTAFHFDEDGDAVCECKFYEHNVEWQCTNCGRPDKHLYGDICESCVIGFMDAAEDVAMEARYDMEREDA